MQRSFNRKPDQLRPLYFDIHISKYAEGSCLVKLGDTHVLCTATVEEKVPPFLKNTKTGWITAEYGMLPRATKDRVDREASRGKQTGRTHEIQRLIGRSLRAVTDLRALGERQIRIDCDVIQADGGTRTASITGGYIALYLSLKKLVDMKVLSHIPLTDSVLAVSCGIYQGTPILDLDYQEDSNAEVDANFILTGKGRIIEIQATAEKFSFDEPQFLELLNLARSGIKELDRKQLKLLLQGGKDN